MEDRLGVLIRKRRLALGLSVSEAARRAGLARNTWMGAEDTTRRTAEHNYAGIERVLGWMPGSIDEVLNGGEPAVLEDQVDEPAGDRAAVKQIKMILESELAANLSAETKLAMIRDVISRDHVPDAAEGREEPGGSERRAASG